MASPRKVLRSQENVPQLSNAFVPIGKVTEVPSPPSSQPIPPRSAFMCFKDAKKHEIRLRHDVSEGSKDLLNLMATEWRGLSKPDRAYWDEVARHDKVRFVKEKAAYKGPWAIPKRRAKKNPMAPKRPMSAFLKFSQKRRSVVKRDNPDMSNTDVSSLLGEMWRNASMKEKTPYVEDEQKERAEYKLAIKKFNDEEAKKDAASRTSHKTVQKQMAELPPPPPLGVVRPTYEKLSNSSLANTFETSFNIRGETVEDAVNKADQRMMFRHNFGTPFTAYRPHFEGTYQHHHPPAPHHSVGPEFYGIPPPPSSSR